MTCNPNYWVYFTLATLVPSVNLAGNYTLTFIADGSCAQRRRSGTAAER